MINRKSKNDGKKYKIVDCGSYYKTKEVKRGKIPLWWLMIYSRIGR